jgi:HSP20 family molecular chaperone IbpA
MPERARDVKPAKRSPAPATVNLVPAGDLSERLHQLYDAIAYRAFEIFEGNGKVAGRDREDWFKAEMELLAPVPVNVRESDGTLVVRAEVPGFTNQDLNIGLEPRRVTITGKRETKEERKDKDSVSTARRSAQILRVIDLPGAIDMDKAKATLQGDILELKAPVAVARKAPAPARSKETVYELAQ